MKRVYKITVFSALLLIAFTFCLWRLSYREQEQKRIKVGVVYIGDSATVYTYNFITAIQAAEQTYGEQIEVIPKYNIHEGNEAPAFQELVDDRCDIIFSTSYGFGVTAKEFAKDHPEIEFCQATCENANEAPKLSNYHTFMGEIYQGRYVCGVVAGMKLQELIKDGVIKKEQAKVGSVSAYPYAEVISGYTSFFLGVRSVVPEATMEVVYINTWSNYSLEKEAAERLIADNCIVITQDTDTKGPAVSCENTDKSTVVYHIGYNQSMLDVAPTTSLVACRMVWEPYILGAIDAVLSGKTIEDCVDGHVHGNDIGAGFERGWVEVLKMNEVAAAAGTADRVEELIRDFKKGGIDVFRGDYIGVNPFDENDIYDLNNGFEENKNASAPSFHYELKDVITVVRD